jgi:serine/threonine-protein phosphatase PPG1
MAPFDLDACIQQLLRKQLLHEALLREICEKTKEVLMRESNVVHVSAPVTVVGDIHGWVRSIQLFDHIWLVIQVSFTTS